MKKEKKYLLIEVNEDNETILNDIKAEDIIDECIMLEEMVDKIGVPIIYNYKPK